MPYEIDGKSYARVTEMISARECEATASIEKDKKKRKAPRTSHTVTLAGTLLHSKIQQLLDVQIGKPPQGLYLEGTDKKLYAKIFIQHRKQRKENPRCQTTYNDIMHKVDDCFANYLAFLVDHPFTPKYVEERLISKKYNVGGTVDLVALIYVKGHVIKDTPDPKNLPKRRYFKICDHTKQCKCHREEVLCVLDWKSSTRSQKGHRMQMSCYFSMLEELGYFEKYRKKGIHICWNTWSVLLGVHSYKKYKTPYQLHQYEPYIKDFLVCGEVYENARYMSIDINGKTGLKGRCMFCSYLLSCPDRLIWNLDGKMEFNTTFTRTELAKLLLLTKQTQSGHFDDLHNKIDGYLTIARKQETEIEEVIPEILGELENELDIKVAKK